jgi:signal transduction histidine kinase
VIIVALRVYVGGNNWVVYSAVPAVRPYVHPVFLTVMVLGGLVLVGLTSRGAYRTVKETFAPVEAIRAEMEEITVSDLQRRVPVPSEDEEELRDLAMTVNRTLDRLAAIVEQQRRFASDASHDLRSPIAAMRAQIEEALLAPEEADWAGTSAAILASLDRLQAIVSDLLTIARLESGAPARNEPVDLAELVSAELERRQPAKQLVADLEPDVVVDGDPMRLGRLLTNLLDNAERHADSRIVVLVRKGRMARLEVIDDGAGIAPEQREVVFQRFTRLDASRSRDAGGTGLGLPIARQIAESHGGTLTIEDSMRGARFMLSLPLAPPPDTS